MSDIAMLGYIAGLFGLIFLAITIFETKTAADLTRQALKETKDNSQRELKAYISCSTRLPNCNGSRSYTFITKIKNYGQTPVINLNSRAVMKSDDKVLDVEFPSIQNLSIPPNGEITYDVTIEKSEFTGAENIIIEFNTEFSDVFNGTRFIREHKCIEVDEIPTQPRQVTINADKPRSANNSRDNRLFVEEVSMFTTFYEDDLQEEAKQYAETNKAS